MKNDIKEITEIYLFQGKTKGQHVVSVCLWILTVLSALCIVDIFV